MNRHFYDLMYRWGAPWEGGPREELVDLVSRGRLTPRSPGSRAIDLGCGSGANVAFLAKYGFDVTGVDFSPVALKKARRLLATQGVTAHLVQGDLTASSLGDVERPYDLLVDYGTLDDLTGTRRRAMADNIVRLSSHGSQFLLWCFYGNPASLPRISLSGASRAFAGFAHGEEV
ncbi:MAG: class I SAM-dependent methyltransferase, partial [Actinomycetes bacterium]